MLTGGSAESRKNPVRVVLGDRTYGSIFLILIVQGIVFGSQMPFMPLWAKDRLGAGSVEVGTISLVASMASTAFGLAYGMVTDGTRRRVIWLVSAYTIALPLRVGLAYVTNVVVGGAMYAAVGMAMFVLYYAILGDWLRYRNDGRAAEITNVVRLGFTIGWLIGAFGGGAVVATVGYDGLFLGTAALHAASLAILIVGVRDAPSSATVTLRADSKPVGADAVDLPLWREFLRPTVAWYLLTSICTGAAGVARMTLLPLYLRDVVHADSSAVGVVFGIEPLYEIPVSLLAGLIVGRVGVPKLMLAGMIAGVGYFVAVALTNTYLPFLAIEALFAVVVTATFGFGLVHVQELMPRRGGTAIAAYNAAGTVGPLVAAPGLGWVADNVGWLPVYLIAATLMAVAFGTMWMSDRASHSDRLLRSSSLAMN